MQPGRGLTAQVCVSATVSCCGLGHVPDPPFGARVLDPSLLADESNRDPRQKPLLPALPGYGSQPQRVPGPGAVPVLLCSQVGWGECFSLLPLKQELFSP